MEGAGAMRAGRLALTPPLVSMVTASSSLGFLRSSMNSVVMAMRSSSVRVNSSNSGSSRSIVPSGLVGGACCRGDGLEGGGGCCRGDGLEGACCRGDGNGFGGFSCRGDGDGFGGFSCRGDGLVSTVSVRTSGGCVMGVACFHGDC